MPGQSSGPVARGRRSDPLRGHKFKVSIDGFPESIGFSRVGGLSESSEVIDYREGTDPMVMRKLPGLLSYDPIVLERGKATNQDLVNWRKDVIEAQKSGNISPDGDPAGEFRSTVSVLLVDYSGLFSWVWEAREAWPSSLEHGDLTAGDNEVILETCEVTHEGLDHFIRQGAE